MSPNRNRPRSRHDFKIAIICALREESDAVEALFDQDWEETERYTKAHGDRNAYSMGRIGDHDVVLAFMPGIGKGASASVATNFRHSFPNIILGLVVGICGGVPNEGDLRNLIFLGDIIISTEVVQYDLGWQYPDKFRTRNTSKDRLGRPDPQIRSFLHQMQGRRSRQRLEAATKAHLATLMRMEGFMTSRYPGTDNDVLFVPTYRHKHQEETDCICAKWKTQHDEVCDSATVTSCVRIGCDVSKEAHRVRSSHFQGDAEPPDPELHFGPVASGDSIMKSAYHRDIIADMERVLGFEMEGTGVWDEFPTLVIKGVSDYSDSHLDFRWRSYAAASAAACMKAVLEQWRLTDDIIQAHERDGATSNTNERISEVVQEVNIAYSLIYRSDEKIAKEDLDIALQLLTRALAVSHPPGPSLIPRIHWGLMIVEKKLSSYGRLKVPQKIYHLHKAEGHGLQIIGSSSQSTCVGLRAQVTLELAFIKGKKGILESRSGSDMDQVRRSCTNAITQIDRALGDLRKVDPERYEENAKDAIAWRNDFGKYLK